MYLNSAIELLRNTAVIVANFTSSKPYCSMADPRYAENRKVLEFFKNWEAEVRKLPMDKSEQNRCLMTRECIDDLKCMIVSFEEYSRAQSIRSKKMDVRVDRLNTDITENIFCSQRSFCHGGTTNPTALQYRKALNTVILTQPVISPKANAGKAYTKPFAMSTNKPLR